MSCMRIYITLFALVALTACNGFENYNVYNWAPTFDEFSIEPFGCKVFDEFMTTDVFDEDSYFSDDVSRFDEVYDSDDSCQLWQSSTIVDRHIVDLARKRAKRGFATIIVSDKFDANLFHVTDSCEFRIDSLVADQNEDSLLTVSLICKPDTTLYSFPREMCRCHFTTNDFMSVGIITMRYSVLASIGDEPVAIEYISENGIPIIFCTMPLLFTNYGILYDDNVNLINYIIQRAGYSELNRYYIKPDVEDMFYKSSYGKVELPVSNGNNDSLSIKILLILASIGLLLFIGQRRQRIIPVINPPQNRTLPYIKHLALRYRSRKEYRNLILKKQMCFANNMHRTLNIDINQADYRQANATIIANATGLSADYVMSLLNRLSDIKDGYNSNINLSQFIQLVDDINLITNKLK